jgi:hypothetical protein
MPPPTPRQQQRRARIEGLIGIAAPVLDLVLTAGDRLSRIVGRDDDYIPIRPASEAFELTPSGAGKSPARSSNRAGD